MVKRWLRLWVARRLGRVFTISARGLVGRTNFFSQVQQMWHGDGRFRNPTLFPRAQPWWVRWYRETNACHISTERTYSHLSEMLPDCPGETDCLSKELEKEEARESTSYSGQYICQLSCKERYHRQPMLCFFFNTTRVVSYFTRTFKNNLKVTVIQDNSQRWCFSTTQRCNIGAALFWMVTTLFQHCHAVLR